MISEVAKRLLAATDSRSLSRAIAQIWDIRGLSRELVAALTERAVKQKDILIDVMAREFSNFLARINLAEEAQKIMEGMTVTIQASVTFRDGKIKRKPVTVFPRKKNKKKKDRR